MATKRFVFEQGTSAKFWQVTTKGTKVTVTYGRLGAEGQTKSKTHKSATLAKAAEAKLVGQKTQKGYVKAKKTSSKKTITKKTDTKTTTKKPATNGRNKAATKKASTKTVTKKSTSNARAKTAVAKRKSKPQRQKSIQFQRLSSEDVLRFSKESKHPGIKALLKEMGKDGIENYDGDFLFYDGDLQIAGSFDTGNATVIIVKGDLIVSKVFRDQCNDGPSCTMVFGDLRAQNVYLAGFLEVKGDLRADETIVGDYNDGGTDVHGTLSTQVFIPFCYPFGVRGKIVCDETWVKDWNKAGTDYVTTCLNAKGKPAKTSRLANNFYRDVGGGYWELFEGKWDEDRFCSSLVAGKSVLAKR